MNENSDIPITTYDRLLRAWENSKELARDYKIYEKEADDNEDAAKVFHKAAEEAGMHASRFRELLLGYHNDAR